MLLSLTTSAATCPVSCGGTNVRVDASGATTYHESDGLPELPSSAPTLTYSHSHQPGLNGTIVVAGPLSLDPGDPFYAYSQVFRRSLELFSRWLHHERGGVQLGGGRYGMRFHWVGDGSSKEQVTNATAHALRVSGADFAISGYSSGLTLYAAKQSHADGRLMLSAGAASTAVFTQNNLTFGLYPPAGSYTTNSLGAIAAAARAVDEGSAADPNGRCNGTAGGCLASLRVAFVQADTVFTGYQCDAAPANARAVGLELVSDDPAEYLAVVQLDPDPSALDAALAAFRARGAAAG